MTRVASVEAIPLEAPLPRTLRTASDSKDRVSIVLVRVTDDSGRVGWGECMGRWTPLSYAQIVDDLLAPRVVGRDPFDAEATWQDMQRSLYGHRSGMLLEAIAGVDTALWDLMGKATGQPVSKLLAGAGRQTLAAYASSIMVSDDAETVAEAERIAGLGFRALKLKVAGDPAEDLRRVDAVRRVVGDDVGLLVDANWAYDLPTAQRMADELAERGVLWLEEPLVPEDRAGYRELARRTRLPIAAGESEFSSADLTELISTRSLAVVQSDVARAGGITEGRRIAALADAFNLRYAPHVGFSGAVCVAATLQLCAAAPNFSLFEAMVIPNPLREELCSPEPGALTESGELRVPDGPGLGIELDEQAIERFRVRR